MPSLRCLISALTQAGGGGLLFRFASSVQSCYGEGGALQADVAACGEHSPCSGHTGFAPYRVSVLSPSTLLRLPAALYGAGPALSAHTLEFTLGHSWFQHSCPFLPPGSGDGLVAKLCPTLAAPL